MLLPKETARISVRAELKIHRNKPVHVNDHFRGLSLVNEALVPVNNVIARNCENHRLKKLQEVDLFIQTLVYIRRFTTSLCCNCFVLTGLSKLTAVFTKSPIMRGHEEGEGRRRVFFRV